MVLFSAGGDFWQEAGPAGRPPPEPDPGGALEEILRDRRAGPAFLRWYSDEILAFWEGHCHEARQTSI